MDGLDSTGLGPSFRKIPGELRGYHGGLISTKNEFHTHLKFNLAPENRPCQKESR